MYHELRLNRKGEEAHAASSFKPSEKVKEVTKMARELVMQGQQNLDRVYRELGDRTVTQTLFDSRRAFNSDMPPRSDDPDMSWRAQTYRPITRARLISIAAHVTANLLYPSTFAQNSNDKEDRAAAEVAKTLIEWTIENSDYERQFVNAVLSALVAPAMIMEVGFAKVMRKIRKKLDDGTISIKEAVDEVYSGFYTEIVPVDELLIANPWENDIQKQQFVARVKKISYGEARALFGSSENFSYVIAGQNHLYSATSDAFFMDVPSDLEGQMVEYIRVYDRLNDYQLDFCGGILVSDPDQCNTRIDKMYPFAKSGYEPIDEGRFFYYKSAADKIAGDQELINTLYNMVMDGEFLRLMPPSILYGHEEVDSSVMVPGAVTSFRNNETKLEPINIRSDLRGGIEAINLAERSANESTQDPFLSGTPLSGPERTSREIMNTQKNAEIQLGLFSKMIGFMVEDLGKLMLSDIMQHYTVAQAMDTLAEGGRMEFRNFILPKNTAKGRKQTKRVEFSEDMLTMPDEIDYEKSKEISFNILQEEGGDLKNDVKLYKVNPKKVRALKYQVKVDPDQWQKESKALVKALNLEAYDRLIQDPNVESAAVTQEFLLETYRPGESDKYMKQKPDMAQMGEQGAQPNQMMPNNGANSNLTGQLTGSNSLGNALST